VHGIFVKKQKFFCRKNLKRRSRKSIAIAEVRLTATVGSFQKRAPAPLLCKFAKIAEIGERM
jgi:hypothetical protein